MDNERIVKVAIGSKVRVATRVNDGIEGARWIGEQIEQLRLDPRSVEFGHEMGVYGSPMPEAWLEGYVTSDVSG